jgi:peptidoglycan/LPS O-acetylase OafA/YrhL
MLQSLLTMTPPPSATPAASQPDPAVDYETKPVKQHDRGIPSLDGIRAVSIVIVLLSHAYTEAIPGGFGVVVFFFLSGYLITTLLRLEQEKKGTVSLTKFYYRRALRIFPNSYLVTLITFALAAMGLIWTFDPAGTGVGTTWTAFLYHTLYLNNYYQIFWNNAHAPHGSGVYWSLAIEEHFYLLFPALFIVLHKLLKTNAQRVGVMIAIAIGALGWRLFAYHNFAWLFGYTDPAKVAELARVMGVSAGEAVDSLASSYAYRATESRLDAIMYGCVLALVGNPYLDKKWLSDRFWLYVATPVALAVIAASMLYREHDFRYTWRFTIQSLALFPIFITAVRCHTHPFFAWLNVPWIRFVGVLSYSLYLVHLVAIFNVRLWLKGTPFDGNNLVSGTIGIAISFVLAIAMYWLLEKPLQGLRRKLH